MSFLTAGCSVLAKNSTRGYDSLLEAALRSVSSTNGSTSLAEKLIPPKPRSHAVVEGVIPPTTYQNQVLDRTKVLHGPRTQTYGETNYLKDQVLDRTKVLHGPQTQTDGETNYLNIKFWTEPRYCMVLGLKPMGTPTT